MYLGECLWECPMNTEKNAEKLVCELIEYDFV